MPSKEVPSQAPDDTMEIPVEAEETPRVNTQDQANVAMERASIMMQEGDGGSSPWEMFQVRDEKCEFVSPEDRDRVAERIQGFAGEIFEEGVVFSESKLKEMSEDEFLQYAEKTVRSYVETRRMMEILFLFKGMEDHLEILEKISVKKSTQKSYEIACEKNTENIRRIFAEYVQTFFLDTLSNKEKEKMYINTIATMRALFQKVIRAQDGLLSVGKEILRREEERKIVKEYEEKRAEAKGESSG